MAITTLRIQGMHCGHCVSRVAEALRGVVGVSEVQVGLDQGRATVRHGDDTPESALREAVAEQGYEVVGVETAGA